MSLAHDHHSILILSHTNLIQTCQNIINVYKMFNDNHSKVILALQHRLITVYQYNSAKITTSPYSPTGTLSLINKKLDNFLEIFFLKLLNTYISRFINVMAILPVLETLVKITFLRSFVKIFF